MAVIINELEQLPPSGDRQQPPVRGGGDEAGRTEGARGPQPAQVMATIRREASRSARLWAD
jgi:hypothetical protein